MTRLDIGTNATFKPSTLIADAERLLAKYGDVPLVMVVNKDAIGLTDCYITTADALAKAQAQAAAGTD